MTVEFDHLFICVSARGEEANRFKAFGLTEGPANDHPGQGTACRRFLFANCYLELLWVCNADEARSETTQPVHLWERWENRVRGSCPFGLIFRPTIQNEGEVPFRSWEYRPPYFPARRRIHVALNASVLTEPMLGYLSFAQRPDRYAPAKRPPLHHRAKLREVTRVGFISPHADCLSPEMTVVADAGLIRLRAGAEYLVELGFDGELRGQQADFRPWLPLLFRW